MALLNDELPLVGWGAAGTIVGRFERVDFDATYCFINSTLNGIWYIQYLVSFAFQVEPRLTEIVLS